MLTTIKVMQDAPVIPVIVLDDPALAVPVAQALVAGGIRMLEVTLRTPVALECIARISDEVPDAIVGAGTVCNSADAQAALQAGARFAVSPGFTHEIGLTCRDLNLPLLPGVATASEVMMALSNGYTELKFFPAAQAGGVAMIKALSGPFPQVRFCPTGGITQQNAVEFLSLKQVVCVGGSWLVPVDALAQRDFSRIQSLASAAANLRTA
ncbi:bifunctional 4-hydroxy-2-oxoglutarate aldolase/2-dehydro-3-deoxy-phosphogluconate aldolase [Orrella sp. NBD-18]|uniref:2-dehydro-3-deoxy-phosphogluconate aldolase n=1 Tax=Sheuella amnicola TaxID=2707330 RepID=A0A6B2R372_9BURK|nr:bifunctional 4-hydroxy-2-oxoglutarate aldolase/2-dehydro-3-deoxy-phosphogluconate aldolase [Sheuella amnicola]NDY84144.1 bifunctional 4-hydroxy-2-oxoglutarate aldolase/2-dehydro-3-deoxy-phosphogluconate aldolase [Sheuella amnicola]HBI83853.1 keto-deoxy-phosphogluconate aldolase [Alcaligenaceae bacterium]